MTPHVEQYSTGDVSRIAGVTLRQLQWWDEQGVVEADIVGHRRLYSPSQLREIQIIAVMRRKGLTLPAVRSVRAKYRRRYGRSLGLCEDVLVIGGGDIHEVPMEDLWDVIARSKGPIYVIDTDTKPVH